MATLLGAIQNVTQATEVLSQQINGAARDAAVLASISTGDGGGAGGSFLGPGGSGGFGGRASGGVTQLGGPAGPGGGGDGGVALRLGGGI